MTANPEKIRQTSFVKWGDPDFSVRLASFDDLIQIQRDADANRWTGRWSSETALREQVEPESTAFLCPLIRNGAPLEAPMSYRCYLVFTLRSETRKRTISFVDVGKERILSLKEASSPEQLKKVIMTWLEGSSIESIS